MTCNRLATALIVTLCVLASPVAAVAASQPPAPLTHRAPSWLPESPANGASTATATTPSTPATETTPAPTAGTPLPRTGFNLLPEVVLGGLLLGAGLIVRLRRT